MSNLARILVSTLFVTSNAFAIPQTQPLLQQSDLTFVGAFKVPPSTTPNTFEYNNGQVAGTVYNDPVNGKSLFLTGYLSAGYVSNQVSVGQIKIPTTILDPNVVGLNGLTTATMIQGLQDPSNGKGTLAMDSAGTTALVVYGGKLLGTQNVAYDGACTQSKSAWVAPINFAQKSQATGPYGFNSPVGPRLIGGGYMTLIPSEWQSLLGGKVVSGNGPWSIIGCGSPGPSLHVIDADTMLTQPAASTNINTIPLVYYQQDGIHNTLGDWASNDPNQVINGKRVPSVTVTDPHGRGTFTIPYEDNSMRVMGALFAEGTRSVLFFGSKGLGPYCYGCGCATGSIGNPTCTPDPGCLHTCYDPESSYKGDHSYPYSEFVWAYDANDLLAAKNGTKNPWDVVPYNGWVFKTFNDGSGNRSPGVAWDAATRLLYMVVPCSGGGNCEPLVNVFRVSGGSATSPCDVNQSGGTADTVDVQLCVNQAIAVAPCSTGDIDRNGSCNVIDTQRVVNAALGGACVSP